jgi:LysR family transcriptional regulator, transcription activator of glutamate synthase operon
MDVFSFKEFLALAEIKNFSEAADQLSVSESTLSRHLKAMEKELGVCLFNRTSRSVELSLYGQIFLPYAMQFVKLQQSYTQQLKEVSEQNKTTIIVGTEYYINDLLFKFHIHNSNIAINSIDFGHGPHELSNMLRLGMCDLAFLINVEDPENEFVVLPYEVDRYVAVLPLSHPLRWRKVLSLNELAKDDFISFRRKNFGDIGIKTLCRQAGFEPRIALTADVGSSIADLVKEGMGVSILQKKTLTKMNPGGIAMVDIEPESRINVYLCYRRNAKLSTATESFIDYITNIWPTVKEGKDLKPEK